MIQQVRRRRVRRGRLIVAAVSVAGMLAAQAAQACTSFLLRAADGSPVYGRTMEMGFDLQAQVVVVPRRMAFTGTAAGGRSGLAWTTSYAVVGMGSFGTSYLSDGLNEKGLAGGILYFPGYVGYADPARADPAKTLSPWEVLVYALSRFATVAEVKAAIGDIAIVAQTMPQLGVVPPFHYTFHDASGASLVVEPVGGILKVYDNPLGVLTNSPPFEWHMANLRNYVKISPVNAPPLALDGVVIEPIGQGSGLLGIPGDPTPPSRFIRALGYAASVERAPDAAGMVRVAEHVLNNFDIPRGFVRPSPGDRTAMEKTQWTTIADLRGLRYYVKTYDNLLLRQVDLKTVDLDAKAPLMAPLPPSGAPPALSFGRP